MSAKEAVTLLATIEEFARACSHLDQTPDRNRCLAELGANEEQWEAEQARWVERLRAAWDKGDSTPKYKRHHGWHATNS